LTLDGGKLSTSSASHFTPRESTLVPNEQEAGWVAELVWTFWSKRKLFPLKPSWYADCAILAPQMEQNKLLIDQLIPSL